MTAADRIAQIRDELADLGRAQEGQLFQALVALEETALTVALPDSAARPSVKNEARRIALLVQRQRPGLLKIMKDGR